MKEDKQVAETNAIYNQGKNCTPNQTGISTDKHNDGQINSQQPCKFCFKLHLRGAQNCPAWGKTCLKCGKKNHF